jgi:hypothetical protein
MKRSLRVDLAKIRQLAFRRMEKCGDLLRRLYRLRVYIDRRADAELVWNVYDWLSVPLTLWPVDFEGLARHLLALVERKTPADGQLALLLRLIGAPPPAEAQRVVGDYEHDISQGRYEKLVLQQAKFVELENQLAADPELRAAWTELKQHFKIDRFQNQRGVIRRRMSQERNFREGWNFDWRSRKARFLVTFDALCYRWDLYGVEKDRPLLLKVSVNPTPHGTMIVIPRHWSFDKRRDLNWAEIGKLHRAHGASRQGPKLSVARVQRLEEALAAKQHYDEATRHGLRGDARHAAVLRKLGKDPRTDASCVKRLLRLARQTAPSTAVR